MRLDRRTAIALTLLPMALLCAPLPAAAQSFPDRPIKLIVPFGAGSATLSGNQQNAEMLYQDKIYRQTPQKLATQLTGVPLPVNALSWWARGLPSPNQKTASSIATSPEGYASSFEQAGWQLSFSRYSETGAGSLPGKIVGTHQSSDDRRYSFKLVISDWSFAK